MAGKGKRFLEAGYMMPKMLIPVKGKTLLQWSVESLPLQLATHLIFIGLQEHEDRYGLSRQIREWFGQVQVLRFLFIPEVTRGQAETVLMAGDLLAEDQPLVVFNIDTRFQSTTLKEALCRDDIDGTLGTFRSASSSLSFAETGPDGLVIRVAEKEAISDNALTGLYHFRRTGDFLRVGREAVDSGQMTKGEFYIAPLYNRLIAEGKRFVLDFCERCDLLGTPKEVKIFSRT